MMASLAIDWRSTWVFYPGATLAYLLLIRMLRYERRDAWIRNFKRKYGSADRRALVNMTLEDAWPVLKGMLEQEFPSTFGASIFFALFKTYGIPTISSLLTHTGQLSSKATASKRATDTGALVTEFVINKPDSERRFDGISRMNYLHKGYRQAGKISDEDMLYTLSLFALEPARWVAKQGWRAMTDLECAALGTFWKDMGEAMDIPYDLLEPYYGELRQGGLAWFEAIDQWSRAYERQCMVPADSNEAISHATLDILTFNTPTFAKPFVLELIYSLMEPRLRASMRIPDPSWLAETVTATMTTLRIWVVRYLLPPRPYFARLRFVTDEVDPKTGRYHLINYVSHPWYIKPTLWARWSPSAFVTRYVWGGILPGDDGDAYQPDGYHIAELGPARQKGKGVAEMERIKADLKTRYAAASRSDFGGMMACPMGHASPGAK